MENIKLIIVCGMSGVGKSTTAQYISYLYTQNGIKHEWYHEEMENHPIRWANGGEFTVGDLNTDVGMELNIADTYARWETLIKEMQTKGGVYVMEGCLYTNIIRYFFDGNYPENKIIEYYDKLMEILKPANPHVIHLYRPDVPENYKRAFKVRGERFQDLRKENKFTLEDVEKGTGIPKSTLHRLEVDSPDLNAHETRVGYQDIVALAKFYDVSADYICGLTENLTHQNTAIDKLRLSDEAITELTSGKMNTRLLSELITHPDFAGVVEALEVLIDGRLTENMKMINMTYSAVAQTINEQTAAKTADEYMATLQEASVDGDDYIRFRLTRRFDSLVQSLCKMHKKEVEVSGTAKGQIQTIMEQIQKYKSVKAATGSREEAKLAVLADQMGVDLSKATEEEKQAMKDFLGRSIWKRFFRKRK